MGNGNIINDFYFEGSCWKGIRGLQADREHNLYIYGGYGNDTWGTTDSCTCIFDNTSSYILKAFSGDKERYAQTVLKANKEDVYTIYPTIVSTTINVDFFQEYAPTRYSISTTNGQLVSKGELAHQYNKLDLSKLSQGTYIIYIELEAGVFSSSSFVKR